MLEMGYEDKITEKIADKVNKSGGEGLLKEGMKER